MRYRSIVVSAIAFLLGAVTAPAVNAGKSPAILVLKEHGIGTAAQAQPYLDKMLEVVAKANRWSAVEGKFVTRRKRAERYIAAKDPAFGIMSLGAFLALRSPHKLQVLGLAEVARAGGRRYHLISKSAANLNACKGQKVATNHGSDARFINKVVARGQFLLSDFDLVKTRRPVQTIKKVMREQAVCALIDDAQLAELSHIEGTEGIRSVWTSKDLPPMAVVAFPSADRAMQATFKSTLSSLCTGPNKSTCDKMGIKRLKPSQEATFGEVIRAYGGS